MYAWGGNGEDRVVRTWRLCRALLRSLFRPGAGSGRK
jgi:hypothetical protein